MNGDSTSTAAGLLPSAPSCQLEVLVNKDSASAAGGPSPGPLICTGTPCVSVIGKPCGMGFGTQFANINAHTVKTPIPKAEGADPIKK